MRSVTVPCPSSMRAEVARAFSLRLRRLEEEIAACEAIARELRADAVEQALGGARARVTTARGIDLGGLVPGYRTELSELTLPQGGTGRP